VHTIVLMSLLEPDRSAHLLPVAVITGFLGSGKTTVLNHLLRDPALADSAVIINEFGEVGIDHFLVDAVDGEMILLKSGCICCTVRADLEGALRALLARRDAGTIPAFGRVIIETTGLADPAPILQLLLDNELLSPFFRLDGVTTTVDAVHGVAQLDAHEEAVKQAAIADRLLLTKTDLQPETTALARRLAALNPAAPLLLAAHGAVAADALFGASPSDPARLASWLGFEAYAGHDGHHDVNRHDARIRATTLTATVPLDWPAVQSWLAGLRMRHGAALLRIKGILNLRGEDGPVVVHGVHQVFHPPVRLRHWPDADTRSRLVFILRDLEANVVRDGFPT